MDQLKYRKKIAWLVVLLSALGIVFPRPAQTADQPAGGRLEVAQDYPPLGGFQAGRDIPASRPACPLYPACLIGLALLFSVLRQVPAIGRRVRLGAPSDKAVTGGHSITRVAAGEFGFLTLIQCGERPER